MEYRKFNKYDMRELHFGTIHFGTSIVLLLALIVEIKSKIWTSFKSLVSKSAKNAVEET